MGSLVVFEGIDASGKATQAKMLSAECTAAGIRNAIIGFPMYDKPFGKLVRRYLDGALGPVGKNHPLLTALLYAEDRRMAKKELEGLLRARDLVICDRYVASNVAYQGALADEAYREELIEEILHIEYDLFKMPSPESSLTFLLDLPPEIAATRLKEHAEEGEAPDIHEENVAFLSSVAAVYRDFAARNQEEWIVVPCVGTDGRALGPVEISQFVWKTVKKCLLDA